MVCVLVVIKLIVLCLASSIFRVVPSGGEREKLISSSIYFSL